MKNKMVSLLLMVTLLFINTKTFAKSRSSSRRRSSSISKSYGSGSSSWGSSSSTFTGGFFGRGSSTSTSKSSSSSRSYSSESTSKNSFSNTFDSKTVKPVATTSKSSYDSYNNKTTSNNDTNKINTDTSTSTRGDTNIERPLWESFLYRNRSIPVSRSLIYIGGNHINSDVRLTNDQLLSLVMEIPNEEPLNYFVFNRKNKKIKKFLNELNKLESEDKKFNEKIDILNKRMTLAYKKDRDSNLKKLSIISPLFLLCLIGGYGFIQNKKSKKSKLEKVSLPFGLEVGGYLKFDEVLFSNLDYDSKFFLKNNENIIKELGVSRVGDTDIYNLYLSNEHEENIYIQIHMNNKEIKKSILFKNLDIVYPKTTEDWEVWLGRPTVKTGILGDNTFIINDTYKDIVQDALFKFIKRIDTKFKGVDKAYVKFYDDILETNLFELVTKNDEEKNKIIISKYENDEYLKELIKEIKLENGYSKLKLDIEAIEEYTVIEYNNDCGGLYTRQEKKESKNSTKTEALYSRMVAGEFFDKEYLIVSSAVENERAYISIDVGIEIDLGLYKI